METASPPSQKTKRKSPNVDTKDFFLMLLRSLKRVPSLVKGKSSDFVVPSVSTWRTKKVFTRTLVLYLQVPFPRHSHTFEGSIDVKGNQDRRRGVGVYWKWLGSG